jgi:hypothetical protein
VNGCESKSLISAMTKILNSFQDGENAIMHLAMMFKNDALMGEMSCIY